MWRWAGRLLLLTLAMAATGASGKLHGLGEVCSRPETCYIEEPASCSDGECQCTAGFSRRHIGAGGAGARMKQLLVKAAPSAQQEVAKETLRTDSSSSSSARLQPEQASRNPTRTSAPGEDRKNRTDEGCCLPAPTPSNSSGPPGLAVIGGGCSSSGVHPEGTSSCDNSCRTCLGREGSTPTCVKVLKTVAHNCSAEYCTCAEEQHNCLERRKLGETSPQTSECYVDGEDIEHIVRMSQCKAFNAQGGECEESSSEKMSSVLLFSLLPSILTTMLIR